MERIKSESLDPIHEVVFGEDLIFRVDDAIQVLLFDVLLECGVLDHPVDHQHFFHRQVLLHQLSLGQRLFDKSLRGYLPAEWVHSDFLTVLLVILLDHCLVLLDAWIGLLAEIALDVHKAILF
jgi:hypothetical protein